MAFDPKLHTIDPQTGFHVTKEDGRPVGLIPAPHKPVNPDPDWPQWVTPHESHVVRKSAVGAPDYVSTPGWHECHVNRVTGAVTVLVRNEAEHAAALAAFEAPKPEAHE